MVTDSLVRIAGGKVYAVANLTSVDIRERTRPAEVTEPIVVLVIGAFLALGGLGMTVDGPSVEGVSFLVIGCALAALGIVWLTRVKAPPTVYFLILTSAAGEVEACSSHDRTAIEHLAAAVMTAITRAHR